jgi:hypothetical protein
MGMNEIITVPMSYKVTLKNGTFTVFKNDNGYDDYEDRLLSGDYGAVTAYGETKITADNILRVDAFIEPNGCEHCKHGYNLHAGDNACPKCGGRTFLPAIETNSK